MKQRRRFHKGGKMGKYKKIKREKRKEKEERYQEKNSNVVFKQAE